LTHSEAERESIADGVQMSSNRIHSGSLKFALTQGLAGLIILARAPQIHESAAEVIS
jgi:hypothetical protein